MVSDDIDYLFICKANIGRSQMAEALYNSKYGSGAISAGVVDFREKYRGVVSEVVKTAMVEIGIDVSSHRIKLVTPKQVANAKKVVVLCDITECPDFVRRSPKTIVATIPDPGAKANGPDDMRPEILAAVRDSRDRINLLIEKL